MDGRSTMSLDSFPSKWVDSIAAFPIDSQTRPPPTPNKRRKQRIRTRAKHSRLQGGPPLMGTLGVHQIIPASDTKLTPRLGINFISTPVVMNKLIPVHSRVITSPPKMSLLIEVEYTPAVTIKPKSPLSEQNVQLAETNAHSIFQLDCQALQILRKGSSPIASQTAV